MDGDKYLSLLLLFALDLRKIRLPDFWTRSKGSTRSHDSFPRHGRSTIFFHTRFDLILRFNVLSMMTNLQITHRSFYDPWSA